MNIFKKLFCGSEKDSATQRAAILNKCDFLLARDEIADMHKKLNDQGARDGGTHYFKSEYIAVLNFFREHPNRRTAEALLEIAPYLIEYFKLCSPGSEFFERHRDLKQRGLVG